MLTWPPFWLEVAYTIPSSALALSPYYPVLSAMAFHMKDLIAKLDGADEDKAELLQPLLQEGLDEAVDTAFVNEDMARAILGGSYPRLSPLLSSATRCARPMVDGWARLGVGGGGGGTGRGTTT